MEKAASLFNDILSGSPSPDTLFLILSRMKDEGHHKRVIQECLKALKTCPCDIPLRRLLAETYFESGRLPQAESEINRVIALIDDLAPAYRFQAEILLRQGRGDEATAPLKCYLAHRPGDTESHRLLEELEYENVISPDPDDEVPGERLSESKEMINKDRISSGSSKDPETWKKRKIISFLEDWRASFGDPAEGA